MAKLVLKWKGAVSVSETIGLVNYRVAFTDQPDNHGGGVNVNHTMNRFSLIRLASSSAELRRPTPTTSPP